LFNAVVAKSQDFIVYAKYYTFEGSRVFRYSAGNPNGWSNIDMDKYGRCFSVKPSEYINNLGIREVQIMTLIPRVVVYFHTPGLLETSKQRVTLDMFSGFNYYIDLEHEIINVLDFGAETCNSRHDGYSRDLCAHDKLWTVWNLTLYF
jgi:hypothetical protein